jgi:hypothetical protein
MQATDQAGGSRCNDRTGDSGEQEVAVSRTDGDALSQVSRTRLASARWAIMVLADRFLPPSAHEGCPIIKNSTPGTPPWLGQLVSLVAIQRSW